MSLRDIYLKYKDRVEFLVIYINEAHPVDGWWLGKGLSNRLLNPVKANAAIDIYDPKTIEERRAVAGRCVETLRYGIRTYVDEIDNAVNKAYAALPTRLYLVGIDGRVIYAGGLGPFGFKPKSLDTAIEGYFKKYNHRLFKNGSKKNTL